MSSVIKFGTSGWRAIVADEFTLANIRLAIAGIAAYVKTQPPPHRVLVGIRPPNRHQSLEYYTSRQTPPTGRPNNRSNSPRVGCKRTCTFAA